ncbi:hypothetical protein [Pseudogemmobacter sonorensis]|uniref:hypothetical protein n=1 Tax=Pseudogemmobacter sonorensis TaxID=2989681 RepID=UPI0036B59B08
MSKVSPLPSQRLHAITEGRLIERPLNVRRSVLRGPWRKRRSPVPRAVTVLVMAALILLAA